MKWRIDGVEWGRSSNPACSDYHAFYLYWWNWLPRSLRYIGNGYMFYDGPHRSYGLYFINISWRFPNTKWDTEREFKP